MTGQEPSWRLKPDHADPEKVDEVVMRDAYVHLEDMGNSYMLIVQNADQHIHLTIPHPRNKLAWVFEQYTPEEGPAMTGQEARDDEREALIEVALASVHAQPTGRTYSVAEVKQVVYPLIEALRKHPEPEITEEQARAVTTVDAIAQSTGMSREQVVATVRQIGAPADLEPGYRAAIEDIRWLAQARDQYTHPEIQRDTDRARAIAEYLEGPWDEAWGWLPSWLWPDWQERRARLPWVPVGEGEQG